MKSTVTLSVPWLQYFSLCLLSFLLEKPCFFCELHINGRKLNNFFSLLRHLEKFLSNYPLLLN